MNLLKKVSSVAVFSMFLFTTLVPQTVYAANASAANTNDSIQNATNVTIGSEVTGTAATEDEEEKDEYFRFTVPSNGNLTVNFKHDALKGYDSEDGLFELEIMDAQENVYKTIDSSESDTAVTGSVGLKAGTYYVHVNSEYDDEYTNLKYSFSLNLNVSDLYEKEYNDDIDTANQININNEYHGQISDEDDGDYYKFTTTAPGKVQLYFNHDKVTNNNSYLWRIDIMDKDSNIYQTLYSAGDNKEDSVVVGLPQGEYYIYVSSCDDGSYDDDDYDDDDSYSDGFAGSADYALKVGFTADANYEQEFNDSDASANPIDLQKTYSAAINYRGYADYDNDEDDEDDESSDVDYFTFNLSNSKKVNIKFGHEKVRGESDNLWEVQVKNHNGNTVKEYNVAGNSGTKNYKIKLNKGKYYITVTQADGDYYDDDDTSCTDLKYTVRVN
ncbi:pre-peptidase C-terminal domain-containing protein [Clostridium oryzae]|uniref:Peptidase C-terminal archaeal/bacterial domain-containing protein n=1 Tax=Clostridium oryzae TaxID=1450648 RepID=A0A1V4IYG0_9CLOT|nr:pre-peptidase C-terminal domain-containing protein [Clostridium oryzae]OPJ65081.1 hypothetical protein CLORY_00810 [Clostridium oryzae]